MLRLENVHIDGFNYGVYMLAECWNSLLSHLHIYDCNVGIYAGSGSEDSVALACDISLYRPVDANNAATHCVYLANQCQNFTFIGCGLHFAAYAVRMDQGDNAGNGTGIPYPMHATFIGCYLEDLVKGGFWLTSSNPNYTATKHAGLTIKHIRAFNGGAWAAAPPNTGQPLVIAQHCSQISIDAINSGGFSYGASIGEDYPVVAGVAGIVFTGSIPGPIDWGLDNSATWGTSRLTPGSKKDNFSLRVRVGDHQLCRLTSSALSYVAANYTRVPFSTPVSDSYNWYNSANVAIIPTRNQTVRFKTQIRIASAPAGNYAISIAKNNVTFAYIAQQNVATANQSLILSGEVLDVPSGTGDYYWVTVYADVNFTLDTANSYYYAELLGN